MVAAMRLRVATCTTLPEPDPDQAPLAEALAAAGITAELLAWDDPAVDWDAPIPTILRSTWNYAQDLEAFLGWLARVAAAAPLWNPLEVCRGNSHKRYLLDLAARGVPTVPTTLIPRGGGSLGDAGAAPGSSASSSSRDRRRSLGAAAFAGPSATPPPRHLAESRLAATALVQPYLASVEATASVR